MRKLCYLSFLACCIAMACSGRASIDLLRFDGSKYTEQTLTMADGEVVHFRAYEGLQYVTNVEDSTYQTLNIYIPASADDNTPIFLRTYVGGYMASEARTPSAKDASGYALQQGYVLCIAGSRGSNSKVEFDGKTHFTGRAPAAILDLKAAVRYLRHNDRVMAGSAERIITDGTSAGGAMSSLLGSSGNSPLFDVALKNMGAADASDAVFAAVCFCPIVDLEHADMAYEWLYSCTNDGIRALSAEQKSVSQELAAQFPAYINSLNLKAADGSAITSEMYADYIKRYIVASAQQALDGGAEIPSDIGISIQNGKVVDIDMPKYLSYVASTRPLKTPPSFDSQGTLGGRPSPENMLFGNSEGSTVNFTAYGTQKNGGSLDDALQMRVNMMNPMYHLDQASDKAQHWYVRHGSRDRDTAFSVPINLATKLQNGGYDVNFALAWDRGHEGDYNLEEVFAWIATIAD